MDKQYADVVSSENRQMKVVNINDQSFMCMTQGRPELEIDGEYWITLNGPFMLLLPPLEGKRGWLYISVSLAGGFEIAGEHASPEDAMALAQNAYHLHTQ